MDEVTAKWINMREQKIQEQADEIERLREALKNEIDDHAKTLRVLYDLDTRHMDKIEQLRKALLAVLDSGLLYGPTVLHDKIRAHVWEAIRQIDETYNATLQQKDSE